MKVYVYGTLKGKKGATPCLIPGKLFETPSGAYPGAVIDLNADTFFQGERIDDVTEEQLKDLDSYEGFEPYDDPSASLFVRIPYLDGWIYQYNRPTDGLKLVEGQNWQGRKAVWG